MEDGQNGQEGSSAIGTILVTSIISLLFGIFIGRTFLAPTPPQPKSLPRKEKPVPPPPEIEEKVVEEIPEDEPEPQPEPEPEPAPVEEPVPVEPEVVPATEVEPEPEPPLEPEPTVPVPAEVPADIPEEVPPEPEEKPEESKSAAEPEEKDIESEVVEPEEVIPPPRVWKGVGRVLINIKNAMNLEAMDKNGLSDPYVWVFVNQVSTKLKTNTVKKSLNPVWNKELVLPIQNAHSDIITLRINDWDMFSNHDRIGEVIVPVADMLNETGAIPMQSFPIVGSKGTLNASFLFVEE